jgi:hypothetical protein
MPYTLKGRITMGGGGSYDLDKTLTQEGMAADAKAAGDAIGAIEVSSTETVINYINENVTNVFTDEFYEEVTNRVEENITVVQDAEELQTKVGEALTKAEEAKTIATSTQEYIDLTPFVKTVNGLAPDEYGNVNVVDAAPTSVSAVKSGNTINVTAVYGKSGTSLSTITLDENGYPIGVTKDGVDCAVTWGGFE